MIVSQVTIYYDYLCPFVYRACEWMHTLQQADGEAPSITWRFFSLHQVNNRLGEGRKLWEQPQQDANWEAQDTARSIRFFWAAAAAARQGDAAFQRYHMAQVRAIHADKQELNSWDAIRDVARTAELDMDRFNADINDPSCLERLCEDHQAGAELKVFGTPTFVFADAAPAYIKLARVLDAEAARAAWQSFVTVAAERPDILEIKRPQ